MNKPQLVALLSQKWNQTKADTLIMLDGLVEVILLSVMEGGEELKIPGLGTFKKSEKYVYEARNPDTGGTAHVPAKSVLKFKADSSTTIVHAETVK